MDASPLPGSLQRAVAAEIRAELGRQDMTITGLERRMGKPRTYWQRRVKTCETPLTLGDLEDLGSVLDMTWLTSMVTTFFGGDASLLHAPAQSRAGIPLRMAAAKLKTSQYGTWTTRVVPFGRAA